jgi:GT2 family glycosyltransferase
LTRIIDLRELPSASHATAASTQLASPLYAERALDPRAIAFITAVKDEAQYRICQQYIDALQIPPGYYVETLAVFGGASMPECYQAAMLASRARYKIYLHVDAYVVHQGLLSELLHLFHTYPRLGLVGVVGSTRLPPSGIFWVKNFAYCYGRLWQNSAPGFPASLRTLAGQRRLQLMRFRPFVGDYLPAAVVDGFFMATQYDIPWTHPEFGFEGPWDHVQALDFIKAGFEVGIARQEAVWCVHYGPLEASSREQRIQREGRLRPQAAALRRLYPAFIGTPVQKLYPKFRRARGERGTPDTQSPAQDRLGIVVVAFNGGQILRSVLRALVTESAAVSELGSHIVVVAAPSAESVDEIVHREFPDATLLAAPADGGRAGAYNAGLRQLGFPAYSLVLHDSVEVSSGTLAMMVEYLREHPWVAGVDASRVGRRAFVETTCMMVRGEVLFDVGLYDERFRASCEDADWLVRARRKGYTFTSPPEVRVTDHRSGASRLQGPYTADRLGGLLWFVYKHRGRWWAAVEYGLLRWRLLVRWFQFRVQNDRRVLPQVSEAAAALRALYHRFRGESQLPQRPIPDTANPSTLDVGSR